MLKQTQIIAMIGLLAILPLVGNAQTCLNASIPATTLTNRFTNNNDGTVTDAKTGLMWKRCSEGQIWGGSICSGNATAYNWQQALQQAQTINNTGFANKSDWRIPNIKELHSIIERQCNNPSINLSVFPNTPAVLFWSSVSHPYNGGGGNYYAWAVNFIDGIDNGQSKSGINCHVRLVRGGQ